MVKHFVLIRGVDGGFACVTQGGCNLFQYRLRVVQEELMLLWSGITLTVSHGVRIV